jgi:hypothetical protein
MKLSKHFFLSELTVSEIGARQNIPNVPSGKVIDNLKALCGNILEPVREYYGSPVVVTSGFRCYTINRLIGGVPNSQHVQGEAADFTVPGHSVADVFEWIKNSDLPFRSESCRVFRKNLFL